MENKFINEEQFEFEDEKVEMDIEESTITLDSPPPFELNPIDIICSDCGTTFTMQPSEQKFYLANKLQMPKRCPECRNKRKAYKTITCIDCGKKFNISVSENEYYKNNGFVEPKRCHACREAKRKRNEMKMENA